MAASEEVERQLGDDFLDEEKQHDGGVESESQRHREDPKPVSFRLLEDVDGEEKPGEEAEVDLGSRLHVGQNLNKHNIEPPSLPPFR